MVLTDVLTFCAGVIFRITGRSLIKYSSCSQNLCIEQGSSFFNQYSWFGGSSKKVRGGEWSFVLANSAQVSESRTI